MTILLSLEGERLVDCMRYNWIVKKRKQTLATLCLLAVLLKKKITFVRTY